MYCLLVGLQSLWVTSIIYYSLMVIYFCQAKVRGLILLKKSFFGEAWTIHYFPPWY